MKLTIDLKPTIERTSIYFFNVPAHAAERVHV